jgi:hypothetical protein
MAGLIITVTLLITTPLTFALILGTGKAVAPASHPTTSAAAIDNDNFLPVPYMSQGNTNWCFLTSVAMVADYFGKKTSPQDMAKTLNYAPQQSVNLLDVLFHKPDSFLARWPDLNIQHRYGIWSFDDYRAQIDAGLPVIASSYSFLPATRQGHTLVVVGYYVHDGDEYVYVNDPSGYMTAGWGTTGPRWAIVPWKTFEDFSQNAWSHVIISRTDK